MKRKRLVRRVVIGAAALLLTVIAAELFSRHLFKRKFERCTSIEWPRPGTMLTPSVLLSWYVRGEIASTVKTSSQEGDRLLKDVKASPLFLETEDGAWQIRTEDRRYEFGFLASDGRIVTVGAWKEDTQGKRDTE